VPALPEPTHHAAGVPGRAALTLERSVGSPQSATVPAGTLGDGTVQHADLLQTIAEVAASFAGFTGVISVFGRMESAPWSLLGARTIIESSLFTILFALVPFVVDGLGVGGAHTWRVSSFLFLALVVAGAFGGTRRLLAVARGGGSPALEAPLFLGAFLAVGAVMLVLLSVNVLGFGSDRAATFYVACLLAPLSVAGLTFLQMVVQATTR